MKHKRPPFLQKNDAVAIVSPSGKIEVDYLDGLTRRLKEWELEPQQGCFVDAEYGRFAGTDELRLYDLQNALDAPNIKAIFCSRGGYGCVHIVDNINWEHFRKFPKWVIGYSDITVLHAAIQHQGFTSIHAPMARHLTEESNTDNSIVYLHKILFGEKPTYTISCHPLNRIGNKQGTLTGGNLSVLYGLRGTNYDIIPENAILFIEDIGERPYQIERMMYSLKLGGILEKISGLIVGQFTEYEEDPLMPHPLYETIAALVAEYKYPVCFNFPVGHVVDNYPLICGGSYLLDVNEKETILKLQL